MLTFSKDTPVEILKTRERKVLEVVGDKLSGRDRHLLDDDSNSNLLSLALGAGRQRLTFG